MNKAEFTSLVYKLANELSENQVDKLATMLFNNNEKVAERLSWIINCAYQNKYNEEERIRKHNKKEGERIKKELKNG